VVVDLTGCKIIVTGTATGIGEAAASYFVGAGATVAAIDVKDQPPSNDPRLCRLRCDITNRSEVSEAFDRAAAFLGGLDALCHPAGINGRGVAEELTPEDMRRMFEINVMGTYHTNQEAWRFMKDAGGSIINFTSAASIRGKHNAAHYAASKGAIAGWTRALAHDWGKYNIRVNAIAPMAYTPMVDVAIAFLPEEQRETYRQRIGATQIVPGGLRPGSAVAPLLAFLCSGASDYITGQTFSVVAGSVIKKA